jgi:hypothetical protein
MTTTPTLWQIEQRANTSNFGASTHDQYGGKILALSNGNFVILWTDNSDAGVGSPNGTDIIGQLYNPLAEKIGSEFLVNSFSYAQDESVFSAAALSDGGFVTGVEISTSTGNYLKTIEWDADILHRNTRTIANKLNHDILGGPTVSTNSDDTYIAAYQNSSITAASTLSRYVNTSNGQISSEETQVTGSGGLNGAEMASARLSDGNHIVVSRYNDAAGNGAIVARLLSPTGTAAAPAFFVANTFTNSENDRQPDVAALVGGGFAVAWSNTDDRDTDVYVQRYDNDGSTLGDPILVDGDGIADNHTDPSIVELDDGGFVVVWNDIDDNAVTGVRFDNGGASVGLPFVIAIHIPGFNELHPDTTLLSDGRIAITWTIHVTNDDVMFNIWDPRTSPINGTSGDDHLTSRIEGATVNGLDGDDVLYGGDGNDILNGGKGADRMLGGEGDDVFLYFGNTGLNFGEQVFGGNGQDSLLFSGPPNSSFQLRNVRFDGIETIRFSEADGNNSDKQVSIAAESFTLGLGNTLVLHIDGNNSTDSTEQIRIYMEDAPGLDISGWTFQDWGGQDELIAIYGDEDREVIHGSSRNEWIEGNGGNDSLHGNGGRDYLQGGEGHDWLDGGAGEDWLLGGPGNDIYYVDESLDFIDEGVVFPTVPGGGNDYLVSTAEWYYESNFTIENLTIAEEAAGYHTTLVAGGISNEVHGNSGDNNLYVNWGDDIVYAGAGIDHIDLTDRDNGATGANTVMFEVGNGYDIIWNYESGVDTFNLVPFGLTSINELFDAGHNDGLGNSYFALGPTSTDYLYFVGHELGGLVAADFILA